MSAAEGTSEERCILCGDSGTTVYTELQDHVFGSTGTWGLRQCRNPECQLAWCSPAIVQADIHRYYFNYYTKTTSESQPEQGQRIRLVTRLNRLLSHLLGATRAQQQNDLMYLEDVEPGRLLDVGCGSGERMAAFQQLGWQVEGQEIDAEAASKATGLTGSEIYVGPLEDMTFESDAYDAVTLNHVLEHVHEPVNALRRCARAVSHGGCLVIKVPNLDSRRRLQFGQHWRGLEPPRHIFHYNSTALHALAIHAGLEGAEVFTSYAFAEHFYLESTRIKLRALGSSSDTLSSATKRAALAEHYLAGPLSRLAPTGGDELVLIWSKPSP